MNGYNQVTLVGTITKDIEVTFVGEKATPCARFSVANNRKFNGKEVAHYFDCTLWGDRVEAFARFHQKGSPTMVIGELRQERWKDKETGAARTALRIHCHTFVLLPRGGGAAHPASHTDRHADRSSEQDVQDTEGAGSPDLPF